MAETALPANQTLVGTISVASPAFLVAPVACPLYVVVAVCHGVTVPLVLPPLSVCLVAACGVFQGEEPWVLRCVDSEAGRGEGCSDLQCRLRKDRRSACHLNIGVVEVGIASMLPAALPLLDCGLLVTDGAVGVTFSIGGFGAGVFLTIRLLDAGLLLRLQDQH